MADIVAQEQQDPNLDPSQTGATGNPAPKPNPAADPAIKDNAEKAAADKAAADKAAEEAAAKAKEEEEARKAEPLNTEVWGDTGSEAGNDILKILQDSGVTPEDAKVLLYDASVTGDISKIDQKALAAKVGDAQARIILRGAEQFIKEGKAQAEVTVKSLHETVGGADNWNTVVAWAKSNAAAEDIDEVKAMIDKGGIQAKLGAKHLLDLYNADEKNTELGKGTEALPGPKQTQAVEPLSARAYAEAYDKLQTEHRGNAPEHLRVALMQRRNAGKAQGI